MEMEADYRQNPTEIVRYPLVEVGKTVRKRKLQAEQLGLPTPKHKCWHLNVPSDEHVTDEKEGGFLPVKSGPGSEKGSNSFTGDYCDSALSVYREAEPNPAYTKSVYDKSSGSSVNSNVSIYKDADSSLDSVSAMEANYGEAELELLDMEGHQPIENFEEPIQEYGGEADYIYSEYGEHFIEECTDKEVEDIIYANSLNPHAFILKSGRWGADQEAQSRSTRKPTIDQEFEEYFSSLML